MIIGADTISPPTYAQMVTKERRNYTFSTERSRSRRIIAVVKHSFRCIYGAEK